MTTLSTIFIVFYVLIFAVDANGSLDLLEILRQKLQNCEKMSTGTNTIVGPTYIRWGKTNCGAESELIYDGYAAGKKHNSVGSGANFMCLTKNPEWGNLKRGGTSSFIYGVETDVTVFTPSIYQKDMPCAVCQVKNRSSVLMIPGRKSCPSDWTKEYWGYVMAESSQGEQKRTSSEYVCVDSQPVGVPGGDKNNNDAVWYLVGGKCGSLKCPPYEDGKELTCVVCSR